MAMPSGARGGGRKCGICVPDSEGVRVLHRRMVSISSHVEPIVSLKKLARLGAFPPDPSGGISPFCLRDGPYLRGLAWAVALSLRRLFL